PPLTTLCRPPRPHRCLQPTSWPTRFQALQCACFSMSSSRHHPPPAHQPVGRLFAAHRTAECLPVVRNTAPLPAAAVLAQVLATGPAHPVTEHHRGHKVLAED